MESWRNVWRNGFVPLLSTKGLEVLRIALTDDDPRLTQGATTTPPPLMCVQDWPVEAACALGFCGWQGEGLKTVGEVEQFFARCCFEADQRLKEAAACRWFLNWFDDTPRHEMRRELLVEVDYALSERSMIVDGPAIPVGFENSGTKLDYQLRYVPSDKMIKELANTMCMPEGWLRERWRPQTMMPFKEIFLLENEEEVNHALEHGYVIHTVDDLKFQLVPRWDTDASEILVKC